ncbi:MAG: hypothetical protein QGI45_00805 [Myxococcota bacterium]|nr:hypothetical protein [Myxococcota bacterium]
MQNKDMKREWVWVWTTLAACLCFYAWIYGRFIPLDGNKLGHDYALHFPNLLAGHFWVLQNGFFSVPWFTPAQCGGLPFYADLNVGYHALPQFLTLWVSPLTAIKITFYVFAGLGFLGTYAFLRKTMQLSLCAALVGSILFFWNGFYVYRMLVGHLVDHGFMLLPWILYFLNQECPDGTKFWRRLAYGLPSGILWAYIFHSGGTSHVIFPGALAVVCVGLLLRLANCLSHAYLFNFISGVLWACCLSVAKLNVALAFLSHFPRDFYGFIGLDDIKELLRLAFESVFFYVPSDHLYESLKNSLFRVDPHELEYGLSPLPMVILALYIGFARKGWFRELLRKPLFWLLLTMSLIPVIFNFNSSFVHFLLHASWFLGSQVNLFRWFIVYTLLFVPLSVLALEAWPFRAKWQVHILGGLFITLVGFNALRDKTFYEEARGSAFYEPQTIEKAYAQSLTQGVVTVTATAVFKDKDKKPLFLLARNDVMTQGYSQMVCYQPLFGYRQEKFPGQGLQPGPIDLIKNGLLNFKNPACYLFPQENGCVPGDHFTVDQKPSLELLAQYKPFDFQVSVRQRVANVVNGFALVLALFVLLSFLRKKLEGFAGRNPEGSEHDHA